MPSGMAARVVAVGSEPPAPGRGAAPAGVSGAEATSGPVDSGATSSAVAGDAAGGPPARQKWPRHGRRHRSSPRGSRWDRLRRSRKEAVVARRMISCRSEPRLASTPLLMLASSIGPISSTPGM